jgi:hypothetical protein
MTTKPTNTPAFAIGETVDVLSTGTIIEIRHTAEGTDYLVRGETKDGSPFYTRRSEPYIFEHEAAEGIAA